MSDAAIKTTLTVTGLHCSSCAKAIEKALLRKEGVKKAELTFTTEKLVVQHDAAQMNVSDIKLVL